MAARNNLSPEQFGKKTWDEVPYHQRLSRNCKFCGTPIMADEGQDWKTTKTQTDERMKSHIESTHSRGRR